MPAIFQPQMANKFNNTSSITVIVICSDHRLLRQDSYKGLDCALTSIESILHKIIIIIKVHRKIYNFFEIKVKYFQLKV